MNPFLNLTSEIAQLSSLGFFELDKPVLSYDNLKKELIFAFIGRNLQKKEYLIEFRLKVTDSYKLERIIIYTPQNVVDIPELFFPSVVTVVAGEEFNIPITTVSSETTIPFPGSTTHLEMLSSLKIAQEKGCC